MGIGGIKEGLEAEIAIRRKEIQHKKEIERDRKALT